jgi:E3 ubiquitin-protein ligase DOA10
MASSDDVNALSEAAVCYLCLDGGSDETDQPLPRDCACRGTDTGFVHLSCLAKYAAVKSVQARDIYKFTEKRYCKCIAILNDG